MDPRPRMPLFLIFLEFLTGQKGGKNKKVFLLSYVANMNLSGKASCVRSRALGGIKKSMYQWTAMPDTYLFASLGAWANTLYFNFNKQTYRYWLFMFVEYFLSFYLLDEATVAKRDVDRLESLFLRRQIHSTPMWVQDFV